MDNNRDKKCIIAEINNALRLLSAQQLLRILAYIRNLYKV